MTWDGIAPECDEFANLPKIRVISKGCEICRYCRQEISPNIFIEAYQLFDSKLPDIFYHRAGECPEDPMNLAGDFESFRRVVSNRQ